MSESSVFSQQGCRICDKDISNILTRKKYCQFCKAYVCRVHIVKKRMHEGKLHKICQECEDAKLYDIVMRKYATADQEVALEFIENQGTMDLLNTDIEELNAQLKQLIEEEKLAQLIYNDKSSELQMQIQTLDETMMELNEESSKLNNDIRVLDKCKKQALSGYTREQHTISDINKERTELRRQIHELDEQCKVIQQQLQEIIDEQTHQESQESQISQQSAQLSYTQNNQTLVIRSEISNSTRIKNKPDPSSIGCCGLSKHK